MQFIFPQDYLISPLSSGLNEDKDRALLNDREGYVIVNRFDIDQTPRFYEAVFEVPIIANFSFANISALFKTTAGADTVITRGNLKVIDAENNYIVFEGSTASIRTGPRNINRNVWPMPYVFRAGQSIKIEIEQPFTYSSGGTILTYINLEGWLDYSLV